MKSRSSRQNASECRDFGFKNQGTRRAFCMGVRLAGKSSDFCGTSVHRDWYTFGFIDPIMPFRLEERTGIF
jgi:hypothetical protein